MAYTDVGQSCHRELQQGRRHDERTQDAPIDGRVGNADTSGFQARDGIAIGTEARPTEPQTTSAWSDVVWIPCADGKARPIKPGIEPLVDGLSGRLDMLRGYGNAIVPQVAAEVIKAYMEICE
jgi:DNA (cytosine-5)-methyltransferase 1